NGFTVDEGETFSFELVAVDNALFTSPAVMTVPVIVDLNPPTVPGDPIPSDWTEHNSIIANTDIVTQWDDDQSLHWEWGQSTDTVSGVSYEVSLFSYDPTSGHTLVSTFLTDSHVFTYTPVASINGLTFEITVVAFDKAGHRSSAVNTSEFVTVDQTPQNDPTNLSAIQDVDSNDDGFNPRPGYNDDGRIWWQWTEASPRDNLAFRSYSVAQSVDDSSTFPVNSLTTDAYFIGEWTNGGAGGDIVSITVSGVDACGLTSAAVAPQIITGITVDLDKPEFGVAGVGSICQGNDSDPIPVNWDNDTNVDFSWTVATDATSFVDFYRVQVHSFEAGTWHHDAVPFTIASNTYTHTLGQNGVGYRLSVEAIDYAGNVSYFSIETSTVVTVETSDVGDVTNVLHSDDANSPYDNDLKLAFSWTAPSVGATISHYNIYVSQNAGMTYPVIPTFTVATTYCTVETTAVPPIVTVATGESYNIYVQAVSTINLVGNTVEGSASLTTAGVPVRVDPARPFEPTVSHSDDAIPGYDNDTSLEFNWIRVAPNNDTPTAVDWFDRYDIYVRTDGGAWVYKTQQSTFPYILTGQNGFSYEVAVVPYDGAGNQGATGEAGPINVITSSPPIPGQPVHTDADAPAGYDNDYYLRFNWSTPPDGTIKWVNIYSGMDGAVNTSMTVATLTPAQVTSPSLGYTFEVSPAAIGLDGNEHNFGIKVEYVNFLGISSGLSLTSTPYPVEVVIGAPNVPNQPVLSEEVLNPPYCRDQVKFSWKRKTDNTQLSEYRVYITHEAFIGGGITLYGPFSVNTLNPPGSWHTYTYSGVAENDKIIASISAVGIAGSESPRSGPSIPTAVGDLFAPSKPTITPYIQNPEDADSISLALTDLAIDNHPPIIYEIQGTAYSNWTQMAGPPFTINLAQNQNNIIRVRGTDAAGRIGIYDEIQIVEDSVGPGSPGKPIHTDDAPAPWSNDSNIDLKWGAPSQGAVDTYQIYVSTNDGGFVGPKDTSTIEVYSWSISPAPTPLEEETAFYQFKIKAIDNLGRSSWSSASDYVYLDMKAPSPEPVIDFSLYSVDWRTGYHTVHNRYFTVELSTSVITDGNGFQYQIKGGLIGDWMDTVPADGVGGNKFVFPLVSDTLNSLEIRAIDPAHNTTNYDPTVNTNFRLYVMEKSAPPPQPSEPKHVDSNSNDGFDNDTTLEFDWDDLSLESDIVSSYLVYVSVNSGNYFQYSEVLTHEVTINGAEGNYYRI
ncbi:hypothetical protein KAJ27_10470, partial [bacterium]|nr:hypothetical protein [bacterium]